MGDVFFVSRKSKLTTFKSVGLTGQRLEEIDVAIEKWRGMVNLPLAAQYLIELYDHVYSEEDKEMIKETIAYSLQREISDAFNLQPNQNAPEATSAL